MASLFAQAEDHPCLLVPTLRDKYFAPIYATKVEHEQNETLRDILNVWWSQKEGPRIREHSGGIISACGRTSVWVPTPEGPELGEWRGVVVYEFAEEFEPFRPLFDALMQERIGSQNIHDID